MPKVLNNIKQLADANSPIDMTRTMAPDVPSFREYIIEGLGQIAALPELSGIVQRHRFHGSTQDKAVAAQWLGRRLGSAPDPPRLLLTGGTQNILMILFSRLVPKGSVIAAEKLTYAAIGQLAMLAGVSVLPVDIDSDGLRADALEEICRSHRVAVAYTNPTNHNPTTSIMSTERRQSIADVARRYGVALIEDDVHGFITKHAPPPIATIAPELTWYMMTVSKCLGIGLRAAYLVAPNADKLAQLLACIPSVSTWFVPGLSAALITNLIETGAAEEIARSISVEVGLRQAIAQEILGPLKGMHTNNSSLHVWLDLPHAWTIEDFVNAAAKAGVTLRHPNVFAVPGTEVKSNIRLSLVAPARHSDLREGLFRIAGLLQSRL
ncbi:PLP-dependent aminotransferase family protein [Bradyrhizobium erythrophlei]|uniref:aminotransferase-like domain-containing protein n=1 Tax=Bradyrhizobium erythrophlei TaxID=1437360 RepID=UPI0035EDD7F7